MEHLLKSHFKKLWKIRNQVHNKQSHRNLIKIIIYELRLQKETKALIDKKIKNKA